MYRHRSSARWSKLGSGWCLYIRRVLPSCADAHYGAVLEAYIEWEPGASHTELDDLKAWLSEKMAAYKVPDCWHSMDVLPKTATGKIDRKSLHLKGEAEVHGSGKCL